MAIQWPRGRVGQIVDIALLALACWTGWQLYSSAHPAPRPPDPPLVKIGDPLNFGGETVRRAKHALVILYDPKCAACQASLNSLRGLSETALAEAPRVEVLIVGELPTAELRAAVEEAQLPATAIESVGSPIGHGFMVTPTLLCVESGKVASIFVGQLSEQHMSAWRTHLTGSDATLTRTPIEIGASEFAALSSRGSLTLLDPRERKDFATGHRPEAVNIPMDEMMIRAKLEVDSRKPVVIACDAGRTDLCRAASMAFINSPQQPIRLLRDDRK